jgi:hypothetical protein
VRAPTRASSRDLKDAEARYREIVAHLPLPTTREKLVQVLPPDRNATIRHPLFSGVAYACIHASVDAPGYMEFYPLDDDFGLRISLDYEKRPASTPLKKRTLSPVRRGERMMTPDPIDGVDEVIPRPSKSDVIHHVSVERWSKN